MPAWISRCFAQESMPARCMFREAFPLPVPNAGGLSRIGPLRTRSVVLGWELCGLGNTVVDGRLPGLVPGVNMTGQLQWIADPPGPVPGVNMTGQLQWIADPPGPVPGVNMTGQLQAIFMSDALWMADPPGPVPGVNMTGQLQAYSFPTRCGWQTPLGLSQG